ncbi:DUF6125 family protein [Syntrophorhabdus aromaticivorans]|uniref:4-vinyl reductase 4VR domain-containing protein n=1 Tax=Syntrophorhabdus aromaticivorans TaxID=328301 RepID=A0A351TZ06_9BACT|nr:DUF6125 family protein [Syntrophorhabdus aromaticivorans]NLW34637.1 hypothetical protein [Syntrophorhabdus aromaticivorans]HBA52937.1 hypothetical protein [Syntrophorhabdus aromaticivorans]
MNLGILETMDAPELREYLRFLLWHYRVMDGFWFLSVEEKYGRQAAEHLDEVVWAKIAGMSAKDLVQRFGIEEKGIKGLVKALDLLPWTMIVGYKVMETGDDEAFITVPECPTQVARVKHGLPEFHCQDMHQAEFESFAHAVDPRIKVECLLAPPDHPPDLFCKWRFSVERD